jgi:hypothetical protein
MASIDVPPPSPLRESRAGWFLSVEEYDRLVALIRDLTDPDDCWFDHHGYCQAHGWMETDPRCPHARAKELTRGSGGE